MAAFSQAQMKSSPSKHTSIPLLIAITTLSIAAATVSAAPSELHRGFVATPDPSPATKLQTLLVDPTGNFSLSFLRSELEPDLLSLAVVHLPSSEPLWTASLNRPVRWDKRTRLTFNGSLVIHDPHSGVIWSTNTDAGDRVVLSPSSNLQILGSGSGYPVWQSFEFPSNTLVEGQNFTSAMTLVSSNDLYTLRLGPDFIGLYAEFNANKPDQIYYKRTAMQAKSTIVVGQGPIYIRISPDGYLGVYQKGSDPADVQSFSSYQRSVPGIRIIRIEPDGNLKAYYWSGSELVLDYEAISETCELPSTCGSYGLCRAGSLCSCLDNKTDARPGKCYSGPASGDFCGGSVGYTVMRRVGVELPYKELMGYVETASLEGCEGACESNCTCWGAVYNNASGRCYSLDYPVQTLLAVGDAGKVGYFKVREGAGSTGKMSPGLGVGIGLLCGALVLLVGAVGFGGYRVWKRRRSVGKYLEQEDIVAPGPYKDLGSIELNNSFVLGCSAILGVHGQIQKAFLHGLMFYYAYRRSYFIVECHPIKCHLAYPNDIEIGQF